MSFDPRDTRHMQYLRTLASAPPYSGLRSFIGDELAFLKEGTAALIAEVERLQMKLLMIEAFAAGAMARADPRSALEDIAKGQVPEVR